MRTSIIAIMLAAILTGGCASVLTIESQSCSPVIDGKTDDWMGMDFAGFENTGIYSASFYDDSTIYLCMKLLKHDDIMKVLRSNTELSYNNGILENTSILQLNEIQTNATMQENMHKHIGIPAEDKTYKFTVFSTRALRRNIDACFSLTGSMGILEMGIPIVFMENNPVELTMLLSSMDQKNMPQKGGPPEGMSGKAPPGGEGMNRSMGNDDHKGHNDNEMNSDREITIKIIKSDTLHMQ